MLFEGRPSFVVATRERGPPMMTRQIEALREARERSGDPEESLYSSTSTY
jgi:hypothetical protein